MDDPKPSFKVCVQPDGETFNAPPDESLLSAIERNGLYWPASCRSGTCRTCMAQCLQGQVRYDMEWPGVTAEEKREGWILPCVARPMSDVILKDPLAD